MKTRLRPRLLQVGVLVAGLLAPTAPAAAFPPQGLSFTVLSKGTLTEPVDIATDGPSELSTTRLTVEPGGSTGWHSYAGPSFAAVTRGEMTMVEVNQGQCSQASVVAGLAVFAPAGQQQELRNDTPLPLEVYITKILPAGAASATAQPAPSECGDRGAVAADGGASFEVVTRTLLRRPIRLHADAPSDIYSIVGELAPGGTAGWHTHPGPAFFAVNDGGGELTLAHAHGGRCETSKLPPGESVFEAADQVHELRNPGTVPLEFFFTPVVPSGTSPYMGAQTPDCG